LVLAQSQSPLVKTSVVKTPVVKTSVVRTPVVKSPEAYRTISEVAVDLDLPQHVLRFWETRFPQIRPMKKGGGRRYYRNEDVDLIKGIRAALYGEGLTIRGVLKIMKEQGVGEIIAMGYQPFTASIPLNLLPEEDEKPIMPEKPLPPPALTPASTQKITFNGLYGMGATAMSFGRGLSQPLSKGGAPTPSPLVKFVPLEDEPEDLPAFMQRNPPPRPVIVPEVQPLPKQMAQMVHVPQASQARPKFAPLPHESFSTQDIQKLQQALHELVECRRLLD
jgi:DNA-binding transcriptional MerR regulator